MADEIIDNDTVAKLEANAKAEADNFLDTAKAKASDLLDDALVESKSFLSKAQEKLTNAAGTVIKAAKDNPKAAAGIAAGAAAAVAGAAYGATKLRSGSAKTTTRKPAARKAPVKKS